MMEVDLQARWVVLCGALTVVQENGKQVEALTADRELDECNAPQLCGENDTRVLRVAIFIL